MGRAELTISEDSIGSVPTYVAEEGTGLAGFYQIDTRKEPPWLDHLWIDPQYMRQGIGRALFSHAAALVKEISRTAFGRSCGWRCEHKPMNFWCRNPRRHFEAAPILVQQVPDQAAELHR